MASNLKRKRDKGVTNAHEKRPQIDSIINDDRDSGLEDSGNGGSEIDQEAWTGIDAEGGDLDAMPVSEDEAQRRTGKKGKKPPTGEELRAIKDATDLFRSSSFKLQIDALLPNVRPKASRIVPLDRFLLTLHTFLTSLSPVAPEHPLEAARKLLKKGIAVPYSIPLPTEDTNWKVSFEKPSDVTLVGSWANQLSTKGADGGRFGVDLAVEMPAELFQEKDYLNGRYFHKRAFYLASIAAAIQRKKGGLDVDVSYESRSNNPRLTTLVLQPRKDASPNDFTKLNAQIRIIPVLPSPSPIPLHRLSPSHSNIRISFETTETQAHPPTPLYNTSLLLALTPKPDLLANYNLKQLSPAFPDALALLRIWANQRGYGEGQRMCVRGFEGKGGWWAAVLGLLIGGEERSGSAKSGKARRPIGKGLSSYQLFRAALDFLAKNDFEQEPVFLRAKDGHKFPQDEYSMHHDAVFIDASSTVNLLAGVPLCSLDMLKHDAKKTLELLDNSGIVQDPFTEVFLKEQRDLPGRFDAIISVDLSSAKPRTPAAYAVLEHGSQANALLTQLATTLRHGLGNRTKAVALLHPTSETRPLSQAHPANPHTLHIGLIYDPENFSRLVDHGPVAEDPDPINAEKFREFWGDKAELRRFKDGRIVESVVWDVKTSDERSQVPAMVVRHLLERHFGVAPDAVQTFQSAFDATLRVPEAVARMHQGSASASGFKAAMTAFDQLVKDLKALDDQLPLSLVNVSPVSEYLRYTSVFTPISLTAKSAASMPECWRYLAPMEIVLEFEKSARWPDELRAIQKIKLAFFERVATVLMDSKEGIKATVVIGDGIGRSEIQDQARLEIVTADGWVFSARIWHDREATLLDRIIENKPRVPIGFMQPEEANGKERQEALEAKEVYTRRFIYAPRHHRAIAALSHRFPAYPGTARLVKRWLASHWLLHGHVTEEAVELICAAFFLGDGKVPIVGATTEYCAGTPGSKERGFATVVAFLKEWKWEDGLVVPLFGNGEGRESSATVAISVNGGHKRGVWGIFSDEDKTGRMWTSAGPDVMVAHRIRTIAKATFDHMVEIEKGAFDAKALFIHPSEDYDFIIHLEPSVLLRYFQNIAVDPDVWLQKDKYVNLQAQKSEAKQLPGFDPARLLVDDLTRVYKDTLCFFYDPFGGDYIGAVWEPTVKQERQFRVLGGFSSIPCAKENEKCKEKKGVVSLNDSGIFNEIQRMGLGLVKSLTVRS